jgi:hypothetical protein
MFCPKCGNEIITVAKFCNNCGASIYGIDSKSKAQIADAAKKVGTDAFETFKLFASNPVGNISAAYERLNSEQVIFVSLTFIVTSALLSIFGINSLIPDYLGYYSPGFFTLLISSILIPISIFGVTVLVGSISNQKFEYTGELFISSVFDLPIGLFYFLAGIFTMKNFEVITALLVFLLSFSILILFTGCVRIIKLTERASTLIVPLILLISAWLTSILFRAIII